MPEYIQNNEFEYYNKIIFMDNNLDIQQFDETVKQLKNQAYIETLEDLLYNSNANIRMYQGYYGPLCICLCIVSVVGLLSYSMLLSNRNRKYYSNVLLCGGTKRDCVILSFFNVLFINLMSLIMLIIICNFFVLKGVYTFESIKLLNIAATIVTRGIMISKINESLKSIFHITIKINNNLKTAYTISINPQDMISPSLDVSLDTLAINQPTELLSKNENGCSWILANVFLVNPL